MDVADAGKGQARKRKDKLKVKARMFDMGHAPHERVANRIAEHATLGGDDVSDDRLHELISDENTHDDINSVYR